jgi:hypothetical protein
MGGIASSDLSLENYAYKYTSPNNLHILQPKYQNPKPEI